MLTRTIIYRFANNTDPLAKLFRPIPKSVEIDYSQSFFKRIFQQTKKAPSYLLLKELFVFLEESQILAEEFPYIKSDAKFQENWMILHLQILKARFVEEKLRSDAINELELETFNYNSQLYFFPTYAKYLNPQTPTTNFAKFFSEAYSKKLLIFDDQFKQNYQSRPNDDTLNQLLKKLVYEHRLNDKDQQLKKLAKYYSAHRKYLSMLPWQDLLSHRIKWGFQSQRQLIETITQ